LIPALPFWPSFLHATPFLIVAAFEAEEKVVVARNKPRDEAKKLSSVDLSFL
jgi:hypothetical protein